MRRLRLAWAVLAAALPTLGVHADDYPVKPVRMVTGEAGGGTDLVARLLAQGLTNALGQQVVVDNRASSIYGEIVQHARADGYTLLLAGSNLWIVPLLQKTPYDPVRDFAAVSLTNSAPNILVVHPAVAAKTVSELIALAKARPGALNYASGPTGASNHLAAELFKYMAGVNVVRIPYKGTGPGLAALIAGEVQLSFPSASSAAAHIKSGRLRALAVTSAQPSALAPGLPTVAASGLAGYESGVLYGVLAPHDTPKAVVSRVTRALAQFLGRADVKEKFFDAGLEGSASTPERFLAVIRSDMATLSKVVKSAGIRVEQ